ncbi:GNAT family N-acetyltransferase [Bacillus sp. FJAT-27245]|uniref:GNAT family N-acetyltransferase n=1 Tax=Bacillus sp. FJAT-27245 TaxID=1684144 RepID=UPI0006A7F09D|nr:GNAT family N-acetyltransferase [Bacillus sp. FJAT-27245]
MEVNNVQSVNIRPIRIDDFKFVLNWSSDEEFCLANGWETNRNEDELYRWWLRCVKNETNDFVRMGIEFDGKLIGYADLAGIHGHSAELGVAIGDTAYWGKGLGVKAAQCMMEYGFKKLDITNFTAETHEENVRSKKMLEKIGFKEISRIGHEEYMGAESRLVQYQTSYW